MSSLVPRSKRQTRKFLAGVGRSIRNERKKGGGSRSGGNHIAKSVISTLGKRSTHKPLKELKRDYHFMRNPLA